MVIGITWESHGFLVNTLFTLTVHWSTVAVILARVNH